VTSTATGLASRIVSSHLPAISRVDRVIFGAADPFQMDASARRAFLVEASRDALLSHEQHSRPMAAFFERRGFHPADLQRIEQLDHVPQIPVSAFKRARLLSVSEKSIVRQFSSSGTSGAVSFVGRDEITLHRLVGSMRRAFRMLEPWLPTEATDDEVAFVNLGPPRAEAGAVWFAYLMGLAEVIAPTTYVVRDGILDTTAAIEALTGALAAERIVGLTGPPAFVFELLRVLQSRRVRIQAGSRMFLVTGGGWKRARTADLIAPDALREMAVHTLGLASDEQVRDGFNQVELNSVFFECERHRKHVPPWVHAVARATDTLQPLGAGQIGLLSYIDASAASYPCAIVTDDFGSISMEPCPCGRTGPTFAFDRRAASAAHAGCALKMQHGTGVTV
jgi:long-chain-fatty-acid---luciferin-component ligase